jgi:predicted dehydrogenase
VRCTGGTPEVQPLRVGIIGLSTQGREHLAAALKHPAVKVVALCDRDSKCLETASSAVEGDVLRFDCAERLFESGAIDAAIVAVPHDHHREIVRVAASSRVHLLKEKPLGRTLREAQQIAAVARSAGILLQTGVQRRHHATYDALKQRLVLQRSRIRSAYVSMTIKVDGDPSKAQPAGWRDQYGRSGGGAVIDLGYHAVDLAQHLVGPLELVSVLMCGRGAPTPAETVEHQAAITATAGRTWVRINVGRAVVKEECVVIDCEAGVYRADRSSVTLNGDEIVRADPGWAKTQYEQIDAFVSAIRTGTLEDAHVSDQVPVIRFIESCYAKARLASAIGELSEQ